ncbi:MAG TPA: hypothetical protein VMU29_13855 [Smithella sp.]|nr:hypothetical protein [Smithella sp.]
MGKLTREQKLERNKRLKEVIRPDSRLLEACNELRHMVENPSESADIIIAKGIYRKKDAEAIMSIECDGVVIGYKIKECSPLEINPYYDRYVYVRTPDYRLKDLSEKELAVIKFTVLEAFFEEQQGEIHVEVIGEGALLMWQRFMVVFPYKFQNATVQVPKGLPE